MPHGEREEKMGSGGHRERERERERERAFRPRFDRFPPQLLSIVTWRKLPHAGFQVSQYKSTTDNEHRLAHTHTKEEQRERRHC